jgi:MFS family permease
LKNHTFVRSDLVRGLGQGVLETGFGVFIILIAIRFWEAPDFYKAALAGGGSIGLVLTPFAIGVISRNKLPGSKKCMLLLVFVAAFIFAASLSTTVLFFTIFLVFAQICLSQVPSLMIQIYSSVYKAGERGKKISFNLIASTMGGLFSSFLFGTYLDTVEADFRYVLWGMCVAALISSFAVWRMKYEGDSKEISSSRESIFQSICNPLQDFLFVKILLAWMILGFGAIMTFPLRIEYLSREDQLNLSNQEIAFITVAIFFGAKVMSMYMWGKLFDRMHFMKFRILLNFQMMIAILIYFNSTTFIGVIIGSLLAGSVMGGANLAWNLWVTKLAPAGKEKDYMSVHMALTGLRGGAAPFVGYLLERSIGFDGVSYVSVSMILISSILFATTLMETRLVAKS